jgi:hypothetical protein
MTIQNYGVHSISDTGREQAGGVYFIYSAWPRPTFRFVAIEGNCFVKFVLFSWICFPPTCTQSVPVYLSTGSAGLNYTTTTGMISGWLWDDVGFTYPRVWFCSDEQREEVK